jgi:hypothetical protein
MSWDALLQNSRRLRIEAAAASANLAVTLFALLDALQCAAATLEEARAWRQNLIDETEPALLPAQLLAFV